MAEDSRGTTLLDVRECGWQLAEQRAQRLKSSEVGAGALAAIEAGASMVPAEARDRLAAGLDALAQDKHWLGLLVAWLDALLRDQGAAAPPTALDADALVTHTLQDCLPLVNLAGGVMLDVSGSDVPPSVPIALLRPDATLVLPIASVANAYWLRACALRLGLQNLLVLERGIEDLHVSPHFQVLLARDGRPVDDLVAHTRHLLALGGRWFVLRHALDESELQRLQGAQLVQSIELPAPGLAAPLQVLHIVASEPVNTFAPDVVEDTYTAKTPLTVPEILAAARDRLDRIEAEMKAIGFWTENPPPLLEMADRGELRSYLDAPTFEQWLQCVFLARARAAVEADKLPESSSVALMAMRQYDYHSYVEEAQPLLALLREFDGLVEQRAAL